MASAVLGQRLIRPLRGQRRISGNVRVVLNFDRRTASVSVPYAVRVPISVKTARAYQSNPSRTVVRIRS